MALYSFTFCAFILSFMTEFNHWIHMCGYKHPGISLIMVISFHYDVALLKSLVVSSSFLIYTDPNPQHAC